MDKSEEMVDVIPSTSNDKGLEELRYFLSVLAQDKKPDASERFGVFYTERTPSRPPDVVNNEGDIITLVKMALSKNKVIRAEGSGHSCCEEIAADGDIVLRLSGELRSFTVLSESCSTKTVKVGGGCYIGVNPLDDTSTEENSLMYQLNEINCALPIVGGITHQTVAGFMSTGSAGGSLQHGFEDVIREIHFINGLGKRMIARKGTDLFNAVGVSLGLFGIITYVVLEVPSPSFKVAGREVRRDMKELEIDGKHVKDILESNEYAHLLWFPQMHARFVIEWTAHKSQEAKIEPYNNILSNWQTARGVASVLTVSQWFLRHFPLDITYQVICFLLRLITKDTDSTFNDVWSNALPSEDKVPVDSIMKTQFTEMWFPMDQTNNVMNILDLLFKDQQVAGNYATEIYGAKKSAFWLSPSYNRDVVRIDPFWFVHQEGDPKKFFAHFWEYLLPVEGIRFHWGKFLPEVGKNYRGTKFDLKFLEESYPKIKDWLRVRERMDPNQVFVTKYWRKVFDIKNKT